MSTGKALTPFAPQVMRGQTLITRTMGANTFHATYVAVHLIAPPGGSVVMPPQSTPAPSPMPSAAAAAMPPISMDRAQSARWEPPGLA